MGWDAMTDVSLREHGRNPREEERLAAALLGRCCPGARSTYRRIQTTTTWDYDVVLADGTEIALEVKQVVDEGVREVTQNLRRRAYAFTVDVGRGDWLLHAKPHANVKDMARKAGPLLAALDEADIDHFHESGAWRPVVEAVCRELHVAGGSRVKWKKPREVRVTPPGVGHDGRYPQVQATLEALAQHPDVIKKFAGAPEALERHLFVIVDPDTSEWMELVFGHDLPDAPSLGTEIDTLRLAAQVPSGAWRLVQTRGNSWVAQHAIAREELPVL